MKPFIFASDEHAPYHEEDLLEFYCNVREEWGTQGIVIGGDLFDNHRAGNRHPHEQDSLNPNDELELSLKFSKELCKEFPVGVYIPGNHEGRITKVMKEHHCPEGYLKPVLERHGLSKKWKTYDKYVIDYGKYGKILCDHGDNIGGTANAPIDKAISLGCSYLYGHWHGKGGIQYAHNGIKPFFAGNAGCGLDVNSVAAKYATGHKKVVTGCVVAFSPEEAYFVKKKTYKACKL
jgi:hypothetical protein